MHTDEERVANNSRPNSEFQFIAWYRFGISLETPRTLVNQLTLSVYVFRRPSLDILKLGRLFLFMWSTG